MGTRYTQLPAEERMTLSSLHQQGWSLRVMGRWMGRGLSTLCRELRRNSSAHSACLKRRINVRLLPKLHADGALWQTVCTLLSWCWLPQQIASTLRRMHPDDPA